MLAVETVIIYSIMGPDKTSFTVELGWGNGMSPLCCLDNYTYWRIIVECGSSVECQNYYKANVLLD